MRSDIALGPYEGLDGPVVLGRNLALPGKNSVYHETARYVAKEKPSQKDTQYHGNYGDKQTLARRGNRKQPIELFPFFLRVGDDIME